MIDPGGPVPGAADIEFQVGIEGEELAFAIDREIDRVAKARGDHGPVFAIR